MFGWRFCNLRADQRSGSQGVEGVPLNALSLRRGVFDPPEIDENGNCAIVTKRLLLDEVQFINREIERHSHKGFIFYKKE